MTDTSEAMIDLKTVPNDVLEEEVMRRLMSAEAKFPKVSAHLESDFEAAGGDDDFLEDPDRLVEAAARAGRGEFREALYHLAVALGREFDWLRDLKPEHLK